jgi:hypothetical protein
MTPTQETGNIYEKLTVLRQDSSNKRGNRMWICQCLCGNSIAVSTGDLHSGHVKSCGCLRIEKLLARSRKYSQEDSIWKNLYNEHCRTKIKWGCFSYEIWKTFIVNDCYYCGQIPTPRKIASSTTVYANGIDRYDSSIGYTEENCVPCCSYCNFRKGDTHGDVYIAGSLRIADNIRKLDRKERTK